MERKPSGRDGKFSYHHALHDESHRVGMAWENGFFLGWHKPVRFGLDILSPSRAQGSYSKSLADAVKQTNTLHSMPILMFYLRTGSAHANSRLLKLIHIGPTIWSLFLKRMKARRRRGRKCRKGEGQSTACKTIPGRYGIPPYHDANHKV